MKKILLTIMFFVVISTAYAQKFTLQSKTMIGYKLLSSDFNDDKNIKYIDKVETLTTFVFDANEMKIIVKQGADLSAFSIYNIHQSGSNGELHFVIKNNKSGNPAVEIVLDDNSIRVVNFEDSFLILFPNIKEVKSDSSNWKSI